MFQGKFLTAHFERENSEWPFYHKHFCLSSQISNDLFGIYTCECQFLISAIGQTIITAQTAFHHCTIQVITTQFVRHCTLKQTLLQSCVQCGQAIRAYKGQLKAIIEDRPTGKI